MGSIFNIFKYVNNAATVREWWFLSLHSKFMWFYYSCAEEKKQKNKHWTHMHKTHNLNGYLKLFFKHTYQTDLKCEDFYF